MAHVRRAYSKGTITREDEPMNKKPLETPSHPPDPTTWVDQHGDFLFRYALSRLGNRAVAEDFVQETFLAALRAGKSFSGRSTERTWFVGILKHKIVDHLRQQSRERPVSAVNSTEEMGADLFGKSGSWQVKPAHWPGDPEEVLEKKEFWEAFRHCLEDLPRRLRTVFSLREMDELPTDEVCEAMQVTPGNLGVLLYRARMGLRRCLEINWFDTQTEAS
ncbi:MAG: sigma-70 family RNA polymerase sigma factor [Gemmataceae bacterium]|nr:sigma-70 family RNA polymerase sigma factor [Gemmataceae bacterium]MCI0742450.1 sigma-70 family RNA polymerase sigma factor [Gemmataceae bacterium]